MKDGLPCYISGKGMFATDTTTQFKTWVIDLLESKKLGYDTRFAYYKKQYPELSHRRLARLICDPIEYYDKDWPDYYEKNTPIKDHTMLTVDFFLPRDNQFRKDAHAAIICFNEAGFGTAINCMRFLQQEKPILGFIDSSRGSTPLNKDNVYQLTREFPNLFKLHLESRASSIANIITEWFSEKNRT